MRRTNQRFGAAFYLSALHQLNLGAVKILVVFAVNGSLGDFQIPGQHHLAGGEK